MAAISLTPALRAEYLRLFNECQIRPAKAASVAAIVSAIAGDPNSNDYRALESDLGVPWYFTAVVHQLEANRNFGKHLHNGDPLRAKTVRVPAGRPRRPVPPGGYSWRESALDALSMKGLNARTDWSLPGILFQLERYNGWGYRQYHPHVLSPYLWSFSTHYSAGKYAADGIWSDTLVSRQCGAAVILRRMSELGQIGFPDQTPPGPRARPLVARFSRTRSSDPAEAARAEELQAWLNTFPGIFLRIDGIPATRTSDAWKAVTGDYLPGDPRRS